MFEEKNQVSWQNIMRKAPTTSYSQYYNTVLLKLMGRAL